MSKQTTTSSGGVGFVGLLGLLFIGLKLAGVITWPWVWVVSPFWVGIAAALTFGGLWVLLVSYLEYSSAKRKIQFKNYYLGDTI